MKRFIAFLIATPIAWALLVWMAGIPTLKGILHITIDGTPLLIQTEEQLLTVFHWMLAITGVTAIGFGIEISAIIADWDRFIQRLFARKEGGDFDQRAPPIEWVEEVWPT